MKVFAHRGLSSKYPENTIVAFEKAFEYNIEGIETDVQLSKDGEMMIFHDEMLERTTKTKGFLKDFTKDELKKLNANNGYEGHYEIPTLDELLTLCEKQPNLIINLELKTSIFEYLGIEQKVYDCVCKHNIKDRVIFSSFNHETLLRMREIDKNIKLGVLTGDRIVNAEDYCVKLGCQCYHPMFPVIKPERVAYAHKLGLEVNVWTCDFPEYFKLMEMCGVDVVMTNCCDLFRQKK